MKTKMFLLAFSVALVLTRLLVPNTGQAFGQAYRLNDKELEKIIRQIEKQSDRFRSSLDSALDKSRFNDSRREDDINGFVKAYYQATKRLHDNFDDHKATSSDVEAVLDQAARIDGFMARSPIRGRAQADWSELRATLSTLAHAYNVSWHWGGYSLSDTADAGIPYRLSDKEVEEIIRRIEKQSDKFRSSLDSALDKSRFDGSRREDDINAFVKDFNAETKRLHDRFDSHKSTGNDVQTVLERAMRIDDFMRRNRLSGRAQREWATLKANLEELASVYNVSWQRWR